MHSVSDIHPIGGIARPHVLVLGGGIAGLATACLLKSGLRNCDVTLVEKGLLGQEASILNGQTLHSGASYVYAQPDVALECKRVSEQVASVFAPYVLSHRAWYLIPRFRENEFVKACYELGLARGEVLPVDPPALADYLRPSKLRDYTAFDLPELQIDTRMALSGIAQRCLTLGVAIRTYSEARRVIVNSQGNVVGVKLADGQRISCDHLVIAAGRGSAQLLRPICAYTADRFVSMLTMHLIAPIHAIKVPIRGNLEGMPVVIPQRFAPAFSEGDAYAAIGSFGAKQKVIGEHEIFERDIEQIKEKLAVIRNWFPRKRIDLHRVMESPVCKTEYLRDLSQERNAMPYIGNPEGVRHLTILVPGKLDLAWVTAQCAVRQVWLDIFGSVSAEMPCSLEKFQLERERKILDFISDPFREIRHSLNSIDNLGF